MKCSDGVNWQEAQTATAHNNYVQFYVTPPPSPKGTRYEAIIVDLISD